MAVWNLAAIICLVQHAVIISAESMPGVPASYMDNFGADFQVHMKQADVGGSYGVDASRYMNDGALDSVKHTVAVYQPGVAVDASSSLPSIAGEFFAGSHEADYKQHMADYAKGYDKFIRQDADSTSGASPYQQYMDKYSAGYQQKYTGAGGASNGQGGNFQDYTDKYMANYEKHTSKAGKQAGKYQQYMDMYAGDYQQKHGQQAGAYQQYMDNFANQYSKYHSQQQGGNASQGASNPLSDYSKYTDHYGGEHSSKYMSKFAHDYNKYSGQAGDYQKFLQNYASSQGGSNKFGDYSKYMDQHGSDHSQYMDKFANQYAKHSSQAADYQKFIQGYAAGFEHGGPTSHGGKFGDYSKYMDQYVGDFHKFTTGHSGMGASAGVDYQKYMGKYTGANSQGGQAGDDEHNQPQKHASGHHASHADASAVDEPASSSSSGSSLAAAQFFAAASQGAGYKQYMANYDHTTNYQKHLEDQELRSSHGAALQKKYMDNFAAAEYKTQADFFENYMGGGVSDYPKYASQSGGRSAGAANYQKYSSAPQGFASYWKDSQAFADEEAAAPSEPSRIAAVQFFAVPTGVQSAKTQEDFKAQYASKYMSGFAPSDFSSGTSMTSLQTQAASAPKSLAACHNASEVQEWEDAETASIEAYVPKAYQESAIANVKKAAADRIEELKEAAASKSTADSSGSDNPESKADGGLGKNKAVAPSEPSQVTAAQFFAAPKGKQSAKTQEDFKAQYASKYMSEYAPSDSSSDASMTSMQAQAGTAPKSLAACRSASEVHQWEDTQTASIEAYVPKAYQESAMANLKKAAADRIEELKEAATSSSTADSEGSDDPKLPADAKSKANEGPGKDKATASGGSSAQTAPMTAAQFFAAQPAQATGHKQTMSNPKETAASAGAPAEPEASQDKDLNEQYANKYIHAIAPEVSNYSDQHAWKESFKQQYFEQYTHYETARKALQKEFPHIPNSASECHNVDQVHEWEAAELASIRVLVPEEHRPAATAAVKKEASARVEELRVIADSVEKSEASKTGTSPIGKKNGEFLRAHSAAGAESAKEAKQQKQPSSQASHGSPLKILIASASSSPSGIYLPAAASLLAVVAFGSVFAVVLLRRRLFRASVKIGLASPLLEA